MSEAAAVGLIADLLLRYFRDPGRYRAQAQHAARALGNLGPVLRLALGRPVDLAEAALAVPGDAAELERAAAFFVRQCFFRDDATHYEVLGLARDASGDDLRKHFRLLMQIVHPDRHAGDDHAVWPESFAARANLAHSVLKLPETRAVYDRELAAAAQVREQAERGPAARSRLIPVPVRQPVSRKRAPPGPVWPEWLTAGVGGFAREHPVVIAGAGMVVLAMLMATLLSGPEHHGIAGVESTYTGMPQAQQEAPKPEPAARSEPIVLQGVAGAESPAAEPVAVAVSEAPRLEVAAVAVPPVGAPIKSVVARGEPPPMATVHAVPAALPAVATNPIVATAAIATAAPAVAAPPEAPAVPRGDPPVAMEVEVLIASFVSAYEGGRLDTIVGLFGDDGRTDRQRGRAAIRGEYDQLFRDSAWRRMQVSQLAWKTVGDHAEAQGELMLRIGWRDGREVEQRVAVDMDLVRQGGRIVIARLSQQPK